MFTHPRGLLQLFLANLEVLRVGDSWEHWSVTLFLLACPRPSLWTPVLSLAVLVSGEVTGHGTVAWDPALLGPYVGGARWSSVEGMQGLRVECERGRRDLAGIMALRSCC